MSRKKRTRSQADTEIATPQAARPRIKSSHRWILGLILAGTGARGMPLIVEISVAFSVLIAFIVIGIFLFRIRERFDTVDLQALDRFRGERR